MNECADKRKIRFNTVVFAAKFLREYWSQWTYGTVKYEWLSRQIRR